MFANLDPAAPMTLSQAAAALPRLSGKKLHVSTIWRWARCGVSGVRLGYKKIGRRIVTTPADLDLFFRQLAEADPPAGSARPDPTPPPPRGRSAKQRERDIAAAERRLHEAGIT